MLGPKRKRVSRACDQCHKLGRKCRPTPTGGACGSCVGHGDTCTYERPQKKRGARPKAGLLAVKHNDLADGSGSNASASASSSRRSSDFPALLTTDVILDIAELYHLTVYPIYCFFSWSNFTADIQSGRHEHDPAFQATILAMCAIVAARARDGVPIAPDPSPSSLSSSRTRYLATACSLDAAALEEALLARAAAIPLQRAAQFDDLRAAALLVILAMQNRNVDLQHAMMGRYVALSSMLDLQDERKWPAGLAEWQKQERRCLYWSTYAHDVFVASIWGTVIRHRDTSAHVAYPDWRLDAGITPGHDLSWIEGWNAVTDLYRILDRVIESGTTTDTAHPTPPPLPAPFGPPPPSTAHPPADAMWSGVRDLYAAVPGLFKRAPPLTGDMGRDMYAFQAANLTLTLQAVKMAIACSEKGMELGERCAVASEMLDALGAIPAAYIQTISAPLLHQLAGVASLLGGVVQGPLTIAAYLHVRQILLTFADLLGTLESAASFAAPPHASSRLLEHVARIDAFMQAATNDAAVPTVTQPAPQPHPPPAPARAPLWPLERNGVDITVPPETVFAPLALLNGHDGAALTTEAFLSGTDEGMVFTLPDELLQFWPLDDTLALANFFRPV